MGNWDRDSHWIPLHYFASRNIEYRNNLLFGPININESTVGIRGYDVPVTLHNNE